MFAQAMGEGPCLPVGRDPEAAVWEASPARTSWGRARLAMPRSTYRAGSFLTRPKR